MSTFTRVQIYQPSLCCGSVVTESFATVLKQLLSDLTSAENMTFSEVSLLLPLCHSQDLALLGHAFQNMDQHYIEEQVSLQACCGTFKNN